MKLDQNGYNLITQFEGFSATPYLDSAGIPTIGFGSTFYLDGTKVTMKDKAISREFAIKLFEITADQFAKKVDGLVKSNITQNQFNSLVSLAYNIGVENFRLSSLLILVNRNPNDRIISGKFMQWNKARIKGALTEIDGLTNRRRKEAQNYFKK